MASRLESSRGGHLSKAMRKLADERWNTQGQQRCGTCKTPVIFVRNAATGNIQILDAIPHPRGNAYVYGDRLPQLQAAVQSEPSVQANRAAGVPYYIDHHATCPQADEWRERAAAGATADHDLPGRAD